MDAVLILFVVALATLLTVPPILTSRKPTAGLITCLAIVVVIILVAVALDEPALMVLAALTVLTGLVGLVFSKAKLTAPSWGNTVAKVGGITLGVSIFLSMSAALGGPWVIFGALLVGTIFHFLLVSRQALATNVFSTIGSAMRQSLPLPAALELASAGHRGKHRLVLRRIARALSEGNSLSESIRRGYPQCPGSALAMIAAVESAHQVPMAIAAIEADLVQQNRRGNRPQPMSPAYPLVVILAALVTMSFLAVVILPSFQTIFADLGTELPVVTRLMFRIFAGRGIILWLTGAVILLVIPAGIYMRFRPRRPDRAYFTSRIGDFIKWHLPVLRRMEWESSLVQTAGFLRLSLRSGSTIDQAIAGAAGLDVNSSYRRRLTRWGKLVQEGTETAAAARKTGVGEPLAWAFDQEVNPSNAPGVLEMLESFYRTRYNYTANMARFTFWPCVTLALAGMVGTIVVGMFLPMVKLINCQMPTAIP